MNNLQRQIKLLEADIRATTTSVSMERQLLWQRVTTPPILYSVIGGAFFLAWVWGRSGIKEGGVSLATRVRQSPTVNFFLKFLPQIIQIVFPRLIA